jgi:hypothetical protein
MNIPPLVSALRPDQALYHEALEVLRTKSCFSIELGDIYKASKLQVGYVRKLILRYEYYVSWHREDIVTLNRERDRVNIIPEGFMQDAKNLSQLDFHCDDSFSAQLAFLYFNCI